jgi:hypothetical protein
MPVHAFFSAVQGTTEKKLSSEGWLSASENDALYEGDLSKDTAQASYTVNLCSYSQVQFLEAVLPVTVKLSNISSKVAYTTDTDLETATWTLVDPDVTTPWQVNVTAVATDSNGSVTIQIPNGSRGIYGPPDWGGAQNKGWVHR